ncbi:uncharacterized protein LOC141949565 isoform X1 [Strix uralensis]|uniref:uncharacterized protein LOC141949565 isoform X1 n=1 Tax=Strix uralensis TaxID=36305 RepID=UPI003DA4B03E
MHNFCCDVQQKALVWHRCFLMAGCFGKSCGMERVKVWWRKHVAAEQQKVLLWERVLASSSTHRTGLRVWSTVSNMRNQIDLLATVTVLGVLEQAYFALQVIYARRKYKISPPNTTGHPEFERIFRAQANCSEYFPIFISLLWVAGIFFHQGKEDGREPQTMCTNQKKPNLNPIATQACPLCTCEGPTWGKQSSPLGGWTEERPNSRVHEAAGSSRAGLLPRGEVWWHWQPSLLCRSPALPPRCFSWVRSGWHEVPGQPRAEAELQHDTQTATSERETITQTISHPPSTLCQAGLGDLAATTGKTQGRTVEGSTANPSPRATWGGREVHPSQKGKEENPFKLPQRFKAESLCVQFLWPCPICSGKRGHE